MKSLRYHVQCGDEHHAQCCVPQGDVCPRGWRVEEVEAEESRWYSE